MQYLTFNIYWHTIIQCESKNPPWGLVTIFPKQLGIFQPNFTCLLRVHIYARLRIFIILLLLHSQINCRKRGYKIHHVSWNLLPQYLAKFECLTATLEHVIHCKFDVKLLIYRIYVQICTVLLHIYLCQINLGLN